MFATKSSTKIPVSVNPAKEIHEIASDFQKPVEVLREGLTNCYDAGAKNVIIRARADNDQEGRRILTLEIDDDGLGMNEDDLEAFFGLGYSHKPRLEDRPPIGYKGHGTKIYYNAREIWVLTRREGGPLLLAHVEAARRRMLAQQLPEPRLWTGDDALRKADEVKLRTPQAQGTAIRLVDFTPDSGRLIDEFSYAVLVNYLRWFTIFGSFKHVVDGVAAQPPVKLLVQGTDRDEPEAVPFGHPWPEEDRTDLRVLKKRDPRRPYNYFCKRFVVKGRVTSEGYTIDIAVAFEGKRARLERDREIRRQRRGGLYHESERYGLWLAKDHIPIEMRSDWLRDGDVPTFAHLEAHRALVLVNCDDFKLTANRGSVGNTKADLLAAVRDSLLEYLREIDDNPELNRFQDEYEEERRQRLREKDRKALSRRIDRYNRKRLLTITLPDGERWGFFEPGREITLFGLLCQLQIKDPELLSLNILDYDDHRGLDLLVRTGGDRGDLLSRNRVAYTELKFTLQATINHAFNYMYALICWETDVSHGSSVTDVTGQETFVLENSRSTHPRSGQEMTYSVLRPRPESKLKQNIQVIVVKRLLTELRGLESAKNPHPINGRR